MVANIKPDSLHRPPLPINRICITNPEQKRYSTSNQSHSKSWCADTEAKWKINRLKINSSICRTALYMPAVNTRALAKGPKLGADAIVIDLEDSVAAESKSQARQNVIDALSNNDYGYRLRVVRVNGESSEWFAADMGLLQHIKPDAILLPKVESAQTIQHIQKLLDDVDSTGSVKSWYAYYFRQAFAGALAYELDSCCKSLSLKHSGWRL